MKAHLVQFDIAWEDKGANHARVLDLLDAVDVREGDLILLPEMFDTGFSMNTKATADRGGVTLAFLVDLADDLHAFVQGGRTLHDCHGALASNVMTIVDPGTDGPNDARVVGEYAKVHPFSLGREHEAFAGGERVLTWDWIGPANGDKDALKVCPAICYDLRFPELFRNGLRLGAECFAIGACWPRARHHHWRALLIARAIENQAYVLGVNRVGRDPNGAFGTGLEYGGGSIAISPTGEVLGELGDAQGVLSVEVDPAGVRRWREKFPAWKDHRLNLDWKA